MEVEGGGGIANCSPQVTPSENNVSSILSPIVHNNNNNNNDNNNNNGLFTA